MFSFSCKKCLQHHHYCKSLHASSWKSCLIAFRNCLNKLVRNYESCLKNCALKLYNNQILFDDASKSYYTINTLRSECLDFAVEKQFHQRQSIFLFLDL